MYFKLILDNCQHYFPLVLMCNNWNFEPKDSWTASNVHFILTVYFYIQSKSESQWTRIKCLSILVSCSKLYVCCYYFRKLVGEVNLNLRIHLCFDGHLLTSCLTTASSGVHTKAPHNVTKLNETNAKSSIMRRRKCFFEKLIEWKKHSRRS